MKQKQANLGMSLGGQFNERCTLHKARLFAVHKFLQDMGAAEAAFSKSIRKAVEKLQSSLTPLEHKISEQPGLSLPALDDVAKAFMAMADQHATNGVDALSAAAGKLLSLSSDYSGRSKAAIDKVSSASKPLQIVYDDLKKTHAAFELAFNSQESLGLESRDPWIIEFERQISADKFLLEASRHKSQLEAATTGFAECDTTTSRSFVEILGEVLKEVHAMSEASLFAVARAQRALQGEANKGNSNDLADNESWQTNVEKCTLAETKQKSALWKKCSGNCLESIHIARYGPISRPGLVSWSPAFAVLTKFSFLYLYDVLPETPSGEPMPRLKASSPVILNLKDCTLSLGTNDPVSLQIFIELHSTKWPAKKYTIKLASTDEVIDWYQKLKELLPNFEDSVWLQKQNETELKKSEQYYLYHYKPRIGYRERMNGLRDGLGCAYLPPSPARADPTDSAAGPTVSESVLPEAQPAEADGLEPETESQCDVRTETEPEAEVCSGNP
jgi:hypothetical protein